MKKEMVLKAGMAPIAPRPGDTTIGPGDHVRSYDFETTDACYVEGHVKSITPPIEGCHRYEIVVARQVFDGKEVPANQRPATVFPPVNGTPSTMGGLTNFVVRAEPPTT